MSRPPSPADEKDPMRREIRAAMDRLLAGTPLRVDPGRRLSVVALAEEAQVDRSFITQKHRDLKDEFYARIRALENGGKSERERELEDKLLAARDEIAELVRERDRYRELCSALARTVRVKNMRLEHAAQNAQAAEARLKRLQNDGIVVALHPASDA